MTTAPTMYTMLFIGVPFALVLVAYAFGGIAGRLH